MPWAVWHKWQEQLKQSFQWGIIRLWIKEIRLKVIRYSRPWCLQQQQESVRPLREETIPQAEYIPQQYQYVIRWQRTEVIWMMIILYWYTDILKRFIVWLIEVCLSECDDIWVLVGWWGWLVRWSHGWWRNQMDGCIHLWSGEDLRWILWFFLWCCLCKADWGSCTFHLWKDYYPNHGSRHLEE